MKEALKGTDNIYNLIWDIKLNNVVRENSEESEGKNVENKETWIDKSLNKMKIFTKKINRRNGRRENNKEC